MAGLASVIRWVARILGVLVIIQAVFYFAGNGLAYPADPLSSPYVLLVAEVLMIVGVLAAWKWEAIGGLVVLAGFGIFWAVNGQYPGTAVNVFALTGCLYLIAWLLNHKPAAVARRRK